MYKKEKKTLPRLINAQANRKKTKVPFIGLLLSQPGLVFDIHYDILCAKKFFIDIVLCLVFSFEKYQCELMYQSIKIQFKHAQF